MKIIYSSAQHPGKCRQENQDKIFIGGSSFAVFDGMGGEQKGGVASEMAYETIKEAEEKTELNSILRTANRKICEYMRKNGIFCMGTTAAIIRFSESSVEICNIGDSRIYKIADNEIVQLSVDHVVNTGKFKTRRVLTQHLGISENEIEIEPHMETQAISPNEIYIICSDGLTDMVTDEAIQNIVMRNSIENTAEKLLNAALANGGKDNISVIVCKVTD